MSRTMKEVMIAKVNRKCKECATTFHLGYIGEGDIEIEAPFLDDTENNEG